MSQDQPTTRQLKAVAHHLSPFVCIGQQGATQQVVAQIDSRIRDHEVIKVKLAIDDRQERKRVVETICSTLSLRLVQSIGKTATLYRKADKSEGRRFLLAGL